MIRTHIKTLLGQRKTEKHLPHAASPAETHRWRRLTLVQMCEEGVQDGSTEHHQPNTDDPHFPFRNRPGREDPNPNVLQIMWNMMKRVQVDSFRPDFSESSASTKNIFLWQLATVIFIRLVHCGEYRGLSPADVTPANILKRLRSHADNCLRRR